MAIINNHEETHPFPPPFMAPFVEQDYEILARHTDFQMDLEFLHSQLEAMETYSCAKYPGIEINYRESVVPTSPEYVTESLKAVMSHGFNGAVLSWNIMEAPVAHIDCLRN